MILQQLENIPSWLNHINALAWIGSNFLIAYDAGVLFLFVLFYFIVFNPNSTTAGKVLFRFLLFLVGVIGLSFIGSWVDPQPGRGLFDYPTDVVFWRPLVRFLVLSYGAFTVTSLMVLLVIRKWWPHLLRTSADLELVKPRSEK